MVQGSAEADNGVGNDDAPRPIGDPVVDWLNRHIALATTGGLFIFVTLRLAIVSHLDAGTALALIQAAGTTEVVAGLLLVVLPSLPPFLASLAAFWLLSNLTSGRPLRAPALALALALALLLTVSPWPVTVVALGVLAGAMFFPARLEYRRWSVLRGARKLVVGTRRHDATFQPRYEAMVKGVAEMREKTDDPALIKDIEEAEKGLEDLRAKHEQHTADGMNALTNAEKELGTSIFVSMRDVLRGTSLPTWMRVMFVTVALSITPLLLSDRVWLPIEEIVTPQRTYVGYVVGTSGAGTRILLDSDRSIVTLRTSAVNSRVVCRRDSSFYGLERSVLQIALRWSVPRQPKCP